MAKLIGFIVLKSLGNITQRYWAKSFITLLLTVIIVYCNSALWLNKNITISFDTKLSKDVNYQVFYAEEKNMGFDAEHSVKKFFKAGNYKVKFVLPVQKIAKLIINIGINPGRVEISDMQINGATSVKLDFNKFNKVDIDDYDVDGDSVKLSSSGKIPYLSYESEQGLLADMPRAQVDWCRLVIISVLIFLLMNKFVQYLSKIKTAKHYSRADVIMLAVFFALLFVPMSHISDAEKSEKENRMFTPRPQITLDEWISGDYGVQFDAWYNDHFFGRDLLIGLYDIIKRNIAPMSGNDTVLVGKNGWLFYKLDDEMKNYANITEIPEQFLKNSLKYLTDIDKWCKQNNKEFYFLIIPDKSKIYGENYRLINKQRSDDYSIGRQMYDYIRKNSDIKVIYPYEEFIQNKDKGYLYYKQDTHWNDFGAYIGYKELMKVMGIKSLNVSLSSEPYAGDLYDIYPIYKDDKTQYGTFNNKYRKLFNNNVSGIIYKYQDDKKNLYIMKDSFNNALGPFLVPHFNYIYLGRKYGYALSEKDLEFIKEKADVFLIETIERYLIYFSQKFPIELKEN